MSRFSHRKIVPEIIDDFNLQGNSLEQNLLEIEWINKNLGGTHTSAKPILTYIQNNLQHPITIADIGCGSGDVLKKIQSTCQGIKKLNLIGVDANPHIIEFAKKRHFQQNEIQFIQADVIHQPQSIPPANVYMMNLFLHHFEEAEIKTIIHNLLVQTPSLIVINDLQRSRAAYYLFSLLCKIKNASFVTFNDGRLSILKGFDRTEMKRMAGMAPGCTYKLQWQWAFRWQLVIRQIN